MRPLKFRAWSKQDKVMVYDLNSPRLFHGELMSESDDYIFMQYTGLNDLKGVNIYEDDIIQIGRFLFVVVYKSCAFKLKELNAAEYFFHLDDSLDHSIIVSNIHERPEILEEVSS